MKAIEEVMTLKEACELWGLSESSLRVAFSQKYKKVEKLIEGVDYRKSGSTWLVTRTAMEKYTGKKSNDFSKK